MANCTHSSSPTSCPPETDTMMARDSGEVAFIKMETQGEGNYASTVFLNADQETIQGLTLPPNIQSSDQWQLDDPTIAFGEQDLDAILGPLQFGLHADEVQSSNSYIQDLINDEYYQMEFPVKRRKLTEEEASLSFHSSESACEQGADPVPTAFSSQPFRQSMSPIVQDSANSLASPLDAHATDVAESPSLNASIVYKPACSTAGSVYRSPCIRPTARTTGDRSLSIKSARSLDQANTLTGASETHSLPAEIQDVDLAPIILRDEASDEASEEPASINFNDDGSLFGDYVSSREVSVEFSPGAKFLPSRLPTNAQLSEPCSWNNAVPTPLRILAGTPPVLRDHDVPIPSVEKESIPSQYFHTFQISLAGELVPKGTNVSASTLHQNGVVVSNRPRNASEADRQKKTSISDSYQSRAQNLAASSFRRPSLPLLIALALASPDDLQSVEDIIESARIRLLKCSSQSPSIPIPSSQVPASLKTLLDSLEHKFNSDNAFRASAMTWLIEKVASSSSPRNGDQANSSLNDYLPDAEKLSTRNDAIQALVLERMEREFEARLHYETITHLQANLENASNRNHNEHNKAEARVSALNREVEFLRNKNARLVVDVLRLQKDATKTNPSTSLASHEDRASSIQFRTNTSKTKYSIEDLTYFACMNSDGRRKNQVCGGYNSRKYKGDSGEVAIRNICILCGRLIARYLAVSKDEYTSAVRKGLKRKEFGLGDGAILYVDPKYTIAPKVANVSTGMAIKSVTDTQGVGGRPTVDAPSITSLPSQRLLPTPATEESPCSR